jgi:hypothetical protein
MPNYPTAVFDWQAGRHGDDRLQEHDSHLPACRTSHRAGVVKADRDFMMCSPFSRARG